MSKAKIIECRWVARDYGFQGAEAIIEHPKHGRILIYDAFGGIDSQRGGMVRWSHGGANQLLDGDTLESLDAGEWKDGVSLMQAVQQGYDDARKFVDGLYGQALDRLAHSLGL